MAEHDYYHAGEIKAVIFDFDGLILDTELPEFVSWAEVYESHGRVLDLDVWSRGIGTRDGFDPYGFLEELIGQPVDREAIRMRRRSRSAQLRADLELSEDVESCLAEARRLGLRVGMASSSDRKWVLEHLHRYSLSGYFDVVSCADGGLKAKPDPALYIDNLARLGVFARDAVAFEDSPHGIAAAKAAGIFCIAIPNTITARLDLSAADLIRPSLAAVSLAELIARS